MNKRICDFVSPRTEPDFFDHPDPDLREVQDEIRRGVETASEVMTITVDQELKERAEKKLSEISWTLEEASLPCPHGTHRRCHLRPYVLPCS